ncbi:DNA (cytosine-5-)-methyltransferase [[Acholeplasma] multilocale]|uniref:DNA (cytosine-5-)-methyltransferase n=1 Tax=[Acholeplasma] multilocale TaxID=264638 RepID=UPI00047A1F7B|nr:DNA (cytosine-5-)-methyltransferase [[Acholeplasma] multilocale]
MGKIKVVELFAGVGGFQLGLKKSSDDFDFVFSNQWEPGKTPAAQYAFKALEKNFKTDDSKEVFSNEDITLAKHSIPNDFDLLVGGFPCQDYSVASTGAKGIQGKKGVLWWEISWILENRQPKMVLLENVDRLLKSPSNQRGRDFAIMLKNFDNLGYNVEWRVINAAEYGFVQRRRRVFVFAWLKDEKTVELDLNNKIFDRELSENGFFSKEFPMKIKEKSKLHVVDFKNKNLKDEVKVTKNYNLGKFLNAGIMIDGVAQSFDYESNYNGENGFVKLGDILEKKVSKEYELTPEQVKKVEELKDSKKIPRIKPDGTPYFYAEGKMAKVDSPDLPARTMLTSESTINRSSHFIALNKSEKRLRKITPIEAERLNGFEDNWTDGVMPERMRYFCMGNALVVPLITKMGNEIKKIKK